MGEEESLLEAWRKLDYYLAYLSRDGEWHNLDDISRNITLDIDKVALISGFYAEFHFIEYCEAEQKVKINPEFRKIYTV